jgi:hypothetical protein
MGLADWMSQLRDWLDRHGIELDGFKHQIENWSIRHTR